MFDDLKEESIVNKVGGRFKLSTLIQKRLVQLNRGTPALVDAPNRPGMQTVIQEILRDKIYLDSSQNVVMAVDDAPDVVDDGGPNLDDL
jgi:DNA-directed RNA polymerase subunit omega